MTKIVIGEWYEIASWHLPYNISSTYILPIRIVEDMRKAAMRVEASKITIFKDGTIDFDICPITIVPATMIPIEESIYKMMDIIKLNDITKIFNIIFGWRE